MAKQQFPIWLGIILVIGALFLINNFGLFSIIPEANIIMDTNLDCHSSLIENTAHKCEYEGHLSHIPNNTVNVSFYIYMNANVDVSHAKSERTLQVWNGYLWETLFSKTIELSGDPNIGYRNYLYYNAMPGKIVKITSSRDSPPSTRICGCDSTHNIDTCKYNSGCTPGSTCWNKNWVCANPCFTYARTTGAKKTYCVMPKVFLNDIYIINNEVKFKVISTHISPLDSPAWPDANYYDRINPDSSNIFSLKEVDFGIKEVIIETINVYRFENNECQLMTILEEDRLNNDYDTLSECEDNIICTPNCVEKVCGDDGCGGSCGTCSSGYICSGGNCVEEITCDDTCLSLEYECGAHTICGTLTNCGNCLLGYTCTNGQCVSGNSNGKIPTFELSQVMFKLGNFEVTLLMLLITIGGFIFLIILKK